MTQPISIDQNSEPDPVASDNYCHSYAGSEGFFCLKKLQSNYSNDQNLLWFAYDSFAII